MSINPETGVWCVTTFLHFSRLLSQVSISRFHERSVAPGARNLIRLRAINARVNRDLFVGSGRWTALFEWFELVKWVEIL